MSQPVTPEWLAAIRQRAAEHRAALDQFFAALETDQPWTGPSVLSTAVASAKDVPALLDAIEQPQPTPEAADD
jgi:hypothetical protein